MGKLVSTFKAMGLSVDSAGLLAESISDISSMAFKMVKFDVKMEVYGAQNVENTILTDKNGLNVARISTSILMGPLTPMGTRHLQNSIDEK